MDSIATSCDGSGLGFLSPWLAILRRVRSHGGSPCASPQMQTCTSHPCRSWGTQGGQMDIIPVVDS